MEDINEKAYQDELNKSEAEIGESPRKPIPVPKPKKKIGNKEKSTIKEDGAYEARS
jgi:hypothetical protein